MRSYDSSAVTTRTHARAHIITAPLAFTPLCPSSQAPKLLRYLEQAGAAPSPAAAAAPAADDGWTLIPGVDAATTFASKPIKAVILATGRAVCLYKVGERVYASDAASTAFKYPLADANLLSVKGAPAGGWGVVGVVWVWVEGMTMCAFVWERG